LPPEEFDALMRPFLNDRALLADRLSAVAAAAALPEVDPSGIAAIGFCFGGLCMLDLARTGAPVTGVASFHGVLTPPAGWIPRQIDCKVAVYHGWDAPFATPDDLLALASELTESEADWQIHAFGQTMHSFMAEQAQRRDLGIAYSARSTERAWPGLRRFLAECFDTTP
jgi:dienelactone hydrolase